MFGKSVNFEDMQFIYSLPSSLFKNKSCDKQIFNFHPNRTTCTANKHLGYFNHIFRFLRLQQCDQGTLPNRLFWKFIEELLFSLASIYFFSEDLFGYIPCISTTTMNQDLWAYERYKFNYRRKLLNYTLLKVSKVSKVAPYFIK